MPVRPTFPGVYIEEVPSGVRTIVGVATSVAAFIDYFARGPMNRAIQIFSFADFEREFGGLDALSEASYAIQQFFLNGGSEAYVIRVGETRLCQPADDRTARIDLEAAPASGVLCASTAGRLIKGVSVDDPGTWGNFVRLDVDYDTTDHATTLFNLTVSEVSPLGYSTGPAHRNLPQPDHDSGRSRTRQSMSSTKARGWCSAGATDARRRTSGPDRYGRQRARSATVAAPLAPFQFNAQTHRRYAARLVTLARAPALRPDDRFCRTRAGLLEAALRAANPNDPRYTNATVQLIGRDRAFRVLTGRAGDPTTPGSAFNPEHHYHLHRGRRQHGGRSGAVRRRAPGQRPAVFARAGTAAGFQANPVAGSQRQSSPGRTTSSACAPTRPACSRSKTSTSSTSSASRGRRTSRAPEPFNVYSAAEAYCLERRAFLIVDIPSDIDTVQEMKDWLDSNAGLRNRNAAVYFPRLRIADPLNQFRLRDFAPSGTMAGLYARTDNDRGVWKAPAGIEATLRNVNELRYVLTDPENGTLNPLGINCLRTFPIIGTVSWGARTLDGADVQASEWKYLPVRRFALFLEESLYRGTKFAVFEPNDEPLWAQIRLNVGAFMQTLFRQGAFQGQTPREAYFVKCDKETTTQNDINQGIVNILVGFAPLKPAEFVIIKISQIAGQIQV